MHIYYVIECRNMKSKAKTWDFRGILQNEKLTSGYFFRVQFPSLHWAGLFCWGCLGRELGEFSTSFVIRGEASEDQSREAIKLRTQSSKVPGFEPGFVLFSIPRNAALGL